MKTKITLLCLVLIVTPLFALAAENGCVSATVSLPKCINQVYIWSLGIGAVLALAMIIFGGYITLTAAGNAERASRGKNHIVSSLIGLILLFGAYLILNTINPDLVNFDNNCLNNLSTCGTSNNSNAPGSIRSP